MLTSPVRPKSMELQLSATMAVPSSSSLSAADPPALSVSSLSTDDNNDTGTSPLKSHSHSVHDLKHNPFSSSSNTTTSNSTSHVVEDEEGSETGVGSIQYSPFSAGAAGGTPILVHRDFRVIENSKNRTPTASSKDITIPLNGSSTTLGTKSISSAGVIAQDQTKSFGMSNGNNKLQMRSGSSYPSPIGRENPSKFILSVGDSPSHRNTHLNQNIEASKAFSQNLMLRRDDPRNTSINATTPEKYSISRISTKDNTENSNLNIRTSIIGNKNSSNNKNNENNEARFNENIDMFHNDLGNLALGNENGAANPKDYSNSFSPSSYRSSLNVKIGSQNQQQYSPSTIGSSSLYSDSFDHHLDKASPVGGRGGTGAKVLSRRELIFPNNQNNRFQQIRSPGNHTSIISASPGRVHSVINPNGTRTNTTIDSGGSNSSGNTTRHNSVLNSWDDSSLNHNNHPATIDNNRTGIMGRSMSTPSNGSSNNNTAIKMPENRNIFPSTVRDRSLVLGKSDDINSQISKSSNQVYNTSNSNNSKNNTMNSMYSSSNNKNNNNLHQSKQQQPSSSLTNIMNHTGNFNSCSVVGNDTDDTKVANTSGIVDSGKNLMTYNNNNHNAQNSNSTNNGQYHFSHPQLRYSVSEGTTAHTGATTNGGSQIDKMYDNHSSGVKLRPSSFQRALSLSSAPSLTKQQQQQRQQQQREDHHVNMMMHGVFPRGSSDGDDNELGLLPPNMNLKDFNGGYPNSNNENERIIRNPMMYGEGGGHNSGGMDGNDMLRYMPHIHPPSTSSHLHGHHNNFRGPGPGSNSRGGPPNPQQSYDYKSMRPPIQPNQHQGNLPSFSQIQMQQQQQHNHYQGRLQQQQQQMNVPRGHHSHHLVNNNNNHSSQPTVFNPGMTNDMGRLGSNQFMIEEHQQHPMAPHPKMNHMQTHLGVPHLDPFPRSASHNPNQQSIPHTSNPDNQSLRQRSNSMFTGNMGNIHMPNASGLPPRYKDEYNNYSNTNNNMQRSMSFPSSRAGMEGNVHHHHLLHNHPHGTMAAPSIENSQHGSFKNTVHPTVSPDGMNVMGAHTHGSNMTIGNNRNPLQGSYQGRGTIDMQQRLHHHPHNDYRSSGEMNSSPNYPPRPSVHQDEPVMNANDGDPYSKMKPRGPPPRPGMITGNSPIQMHQNFIPPSSPQSNRNVDTMRGGEMTNGMKGVPKHLNIPHGFVPRGSFDSSSHDEGLTVSGGHRHKMMNSVPPHSQQQQMVGSSIAASLQNSVRSSQGSESSCASMENNNSNSSPTIVSPYSSSREVPISTTAKPSTATAGANNTNTGPRVVYNIKFKRTQRSFILGPRAPRDVKIGCYVKVEADRGEDLGFVVSRMSAEKYNATGRSSYRLNNNPGNANGNGTTSGCLNPSSLGGGGGGGGAVDLKQVIRLATHDEVNHLKVKKNEEDELLKICRSKVKTRGLPMTVCDAEYQFDRNKLTFFFEAEGRIDFRELVRDLFSIYKTRIWMQQLDKNTNTPGGGANGNGSSNVAGDGINSANGESSESPN